MSADPTAGRSGASIPRRQVGMPGAGRLLPSEIRWLRLLLGAALSLLLALAVGSLLLERSTHTRLVRVGQLAPAFTLPSASGGMVTLGALRGRPVALAFVPSVRSPLGQRQLGALQQALPVLRARDVVVLAISTDELAVQRATAQSLGLSYLLLGEAPTHGEHPAGSAYGVYHLAEPDPGPVDANALFVIDASGIIRAERIQPTMVIATPNILGLVTAGLGSTGGNGGGQ